MSPGGKVSAARVRLVRGGPERPGPVLYWMSRDQRVRDNWALIGAQGLALERRAPLAVCFALAPAFLGAAWRHYDFMLRGLREVEDSLREKNIPFVLLAGRPEREVPAFVRRSGASALVTDFCPLRIKRGWVEGVARRITVPFHQVDAHNVVPCWRASPKEEYGARTFRPKIRRALGEFLEPFAPLRRHPFGWRGTLPPNGWEEAERGLRADRSVGPVAWLRPGEAAARRRLGRFLRRGLKGYARERNDPTAKAQSGLSPYLHFGQLSAQRCALEALDKAPAAGDREAFLEELVVRRELSDNFCFYNESYDKVEGFPAWARKTLDDHRRDPRPHTYTRGELEAGATHDALWNAAQEEMVLGGKMHGYLRMYWAKKILEWTSSPEEALETAIYLNDRYEIDGRDPNGYAGIAWSIGGVHDRAWPERPVFGKLRYMSERGCRGKFDVDAYIRAVRGLEA